MLTQYTNKDKLLNESKATNAERYDANDLDLFKKSVFQYGEVNLGTANASNEFHVYSGDTWITGKHKVDLENFDQAAFTKDGAQIQLTSPVKFKLSQELRKLELTSGNYRIILNFFINILGSYNAPLMAIDDISPDRTEVRLRAIDETNPKFLLSINQYINNVAGIQTALTDDDNVSFLLNFSRNKTNLFVNSVVVGKYLFVKLYKPLDDEIEKNFKCWIVRENKLPYVDNISVSEVLDQITFNVLQGTNWEASAEQDTSNATTLKSWSDLLGSSMQTSQQIIDSYFSGSLGGVKLNIDFGDFNNFVFYSSATERLDNFKYKIELLEYYTAQSASAGLLSGSAAIANAADFNNLYTNLIGGMDQFEQYLYYDSSSKIFTHDIPVANPVVEFVTGSYISPAPKSNSTYPFELYSVTSSNFESWYTGIHESASIYDLRNNNRLIRSIPEFMLLDENNEQLSTFVNMLGHHYDILYTYINAMTLINSRDEHPKQGMPNELLYTVAKQFGWKLTNGAQSTDLWEYTLGTDSNGTPLTGSNSVGDPSLPLRDVTYGIWRRIVNNIPGLLKSKGTKRSVQALLACYGVPQSLITIQEYGGPRLKRPPSYEKLNFDYSLDLIKNTTGVVRVDYNQTIGAVELRFRTDNVLKNPLVPGTMNLFSAGGNDVTLEFSRGTMGRIQINGTSSAEIEMFEGDYLTALLRTGSNNSIEVLAKKSKFGKIINTVSASATGSFSNPGTVLIGGTSGGSRLLGQVQELRMWTGSLNNAPYTNHTKAPSAYDGNIDAYDELVFRTPLTQKVNHAATGSLTGVQPDIKTTISASFTGSGYPAWTNSTPYDSIEETYYFDGISLGGGTFDDNKVRIESTELLNTLNVENRATRNAFDTAPLDSSKLGIYYSPQTMINDDIIAQLGFTILDDLIGDPRAKENRYAYPDLINTSREYWKKYATHNDMNSYLRIFSLFDLSFFKQLEQLLPARSEKILGLLIQPTIIERSKDTALTQISKLNQTHLSELKVPDFVIPSASRQNPEGKIIIPEIVIPSASRQNPEGDIIVAENIVSGSQQNFVTELNAAADISDNKVQIFASASLPAVGDELVEGEWQSFASGSLPTVGDSLLAGKWQSFVSGSLPVIGDNLIEAVDQFVGSGSLPIIGDALLAAEDQFIGSSSIDTRPFVDGANQLSAVGETSALPDVAGANQTTTSGSVDTNPDIGGANQITTSGSADAKPIVNSIALIDYDTKLQFFSIDGITVNYNARLITNKDPYNGSSYSHTSIIFSGSSFVTSSTPYWESEAISLFVTSSRVSEFVKTRYKLGITGSELRVAEFQDYLPTGIANHRFNGCKISSPDYNVNSLDTPDGKPVIEVSITTGNKLYIEPPGSKGLFDVKG